MKLLCICDDWIGGMEQITAAQALSALHDAEYTAKPFMYCPWCGELLVVEGSVEYTMRLLKNGLDKVRESLYAVYKSLLENTRNSND